MMKISNQNEIEKLRQELGPWLSKKKIPIKIFDNLPLLQKFWLHGVAYTGNLHLSDAQFRTLYQNLALSERRLGGLGSIGPSAVESISHEELEEFFRPLSPSERLPYLYKY